MKVRAVGAAEERQFTTRLLQKNEASRLGKMIRLFDLAFEESTGDDLAEDFLHRLLANETFLAVAAFDAADEIVGGLTAYVLPRYTPDATEAFIFDVAVHPDFRRQGIGASMLRHFHDHCSSHGIRETFVPAHEEDEPALELYRKAGGEEEKVRLFVFRPGA